MPHEDLVGAYYQHVTDIHRLAKGDSIHFAVFTGSESLQDAMAATERGLADEGGFRAGMEILDVGCGVGGPALTIAAYTGARIVGIDIVERHVEIARHSATEIGLAHLVRFEQADAMAMPFPDASFDRVYLFESGCHMPDKAAFVAECARVLRPGGLFLGNDWMAQDGLSAEERAAYLEPVCRHHGMPHLASPSEMASWLQAAGLVVEEVRDLAERGNLQRNWDAVNHAAIERGLLGLPRGEGLAVLQTLVEGGVALSGALQAGAFLIGHFRAHKPSVQPRQGVSASDR